MDSTNQNLFASLSKKGLVRKENQDFSVVTFNRFGQLMSLVCDGLGGYKGGKMASALVSEVFTKSFTVFDFHSQTERAVKQWFEITLIEARRTLEQYFQTIKRNQVQFARMATTLVLSIISKQNIWTFWVGDSRAYLINSYQSLQITEDHNLYNQLLQMHATPDVIASYKDKLLALTATVSKDQERQLKYSFRCDVVNAWDFLLLCSDGLYNFLDPNCFYEVITSAPNLKKAVTQLAKLSLDNASNDNITLNLINLKQWH
ncbi:PP2C family serine/threonine-protein phosphatase [Mycoplasmoides pneumoniae]|uniref:PP2C family serine/threonine-protein phosphatase n=1 Tax=Mycoplasmoides pneumoniae TaxID=2104 RepID=UPI0006BA2731|nr:PP2C family serine/threonine-protein phosphatase [Mycoplasmoides pneumoniae]ARQ34396.1 protein phosphatase [Mycoplasmoides pneumoniae]ARQ41480.1 protein phosphatase [Mycoplasmoides pneumoniae]ARQ43607.1 protein phosphatase [Mycoplasmoides pneumoniae]QHR08012.1 serine/threonine-protein phosphatase [Mycoplasmoides pneumoniae]QHR10115.1 serine/threonine-protein phosphatase [Mycoplasmoides pneumoniae]